MTGNPSFPSYHFDFFSRINRLSCCVFLFCVTSTVAYFLNNRCYATGDCIISATQVGGFNDEYQRWLIECADGEAMTGITDTADYTTISEVWCHFTFPLKPPSLGIYPYYSMCNTRNLSMYEYYCYDKLYPTDTVNTFTTALYTPSSIQPVNLMKCCKTPSDYRLDYNGCQWKYTHDKSGEHYDIFIQCDTNAVMTGLGTAISPWNNASHFVWIQCCPVITVSTYRPNWQNSISERNLDCDNTSKCSSEAPTQVHRVFPRSTE